MLKAIYFNIPAHGHGNPSLPLLAELVQRGEQIIYVNSDEFRAAVEATGARFMAYPTVAELKHLMETASAGHLARNALKLVQIGKQLLPFVQQLIDAEKPDYLIYDSLAGWGPMSAQLCRLPTVSTIVTFALTREAMPPISPGAFLHMMTGFARVFPTYMSTARSIRQAYGVKPVALTDALMNLADLNIVFTSREFQPAGARFNDSFKFVGPSIGARPVQVDFPFDLLTGDRPVIYISLGTINNQNLIFYRQSFEALGDYPAQVILSIGRQTDIASLGTVPENFIVRNFVPQLEILERSHLFVTHGGLNSVHEGFLNGVPLVVIPQQVEQAIVAQRVAKTGAGIALGDKPPFGRITSSQLRQAVERALGPEGTKFKQNAQQLGDSLRKAGGSAKAAEEILAFTHAKLPI
jgi:MGT family glycosyltransferase